MKCPEVDIDKLKEFKEKNFRERIKFIEMYAEWMKNHPDKVWSRQHNKFINSLIK